MMNTLSCRSLMPKSLSENGDLLILREQDADTLSGLAVERRRPLRQQKDETEEIVQCEYGANYLFSDLN